MRNEKVREVAAVKKRKKNKAARPRTLGFSKLCGRLYPRFLTPLIIGLTVMGAASALYAVHASAVTLAIFYASAAISAACVALTSVRSVLGAVSSPKMMLECIDEGDRVFVRAGTVAAAVCVSTLTASILASGFVLFYVMLFSESKLTAFAAELAFLSALYYISLVLAVTAAKYDPRQKTERRRFIFGVVGVYTVGLLALLFILACFSAIPLGADFSGLAIPPGTAAALAGVYLAATMLRSAYLYLILIRRLRRAMKLK